MTLSKHRLAFKDHIGRYMVSFLPLQLLHFGILRGFQAQGADYRRFLVPGHLSGWLKHLAGVLRKDLR
jgi:hypothetical protein